MTTVARPFSASNLALRGPSMEGQRFNRWKLQGPAFQIGRHVRVVVTCDCGAVAVSYLSDVIAGRSRSCGCLPIEINTKHGEGSARNNKQTRLFNCWRNMRQRCSNPNNRGYRWYGAKGVSVCEEWRDDYVAFRQWAMNSGYDDSLSIDRIDPSGNYEPTNCRWIPFSENLERSRPKRKESQA